MGNALSNSSKKANHHKNTKSYVYWYQTVFLTLRPPAITNLCPTPLLRLLGAHLGPNSSVQVVVPAVFTLWSVR